VASACFVDSSALVKRYVQEAGTAWVRRLTRRSDRTRIYLTPALFDEAMRLANKHALRAYDAVQLAAALKIRGERQDAGLAPVTLISADQGLNDAALVEGMAVDDPRLHP
jgi:predicted nucleic acid-binding protein